MRNPRVVSSLATRFVIRLATIAINNVNEPAIAQICSFLVRQEFLAVIRPSDVQALVYLRDQRNSRGYANLIRTGDDALFIETFNVLRNNNFSVYSSMLLLNVGNVNPFPYVNGFGAHPAGNQGNHGGNNNHGGGNNNHGSGNNNQGGGNGAEGAEGGAITTKEAAKIILAASFSTFFALPPP